ncbi:MULTISPECIES: HIT family protein [unclassified Saccharopolyspora]|uniref:HIT family protein n=1 Tax=unclassified Saccharopolyspora TaxID=2646250 RepID=UPI001CD7D837|nr:MULTISPECIES: HIT family protein [unclassified Saccharopolyspora]MCA1189186.1 HIT family protein [Saccharopolyspora sp. 6T]MCA1196116.1 HIT family protein [Saccharopolyspora sp. 6V]MCA1226694.1 HIT family protein [Saccharopolyspora sp. 6M]MCA1282924.1 HIT family protein [Saccharopolyspora sp. 7B]
MTENYDPENPFAKIIRGEGPAHVVHEDDDVLAFLDVFPQSPGHVLVVPKSGEPRTLLDVTPEQLTAVVHVVQRVARAVTDELRPAGVQIVQFNEAAAGQTVFHLHFHVIPRYGTGELLPHAGIRGDAERLGELQRRISSRLAAQRPAA